MQVWLPLGQGVFSSKFLLKNNVNFFIGNIVVTIHSSIYWIHKKEWAKEQQIKEYSTIILVKSSLKEIHSSL